MIIPSPTTTKPQSSNFASSHSDSKPSEMDLPSYSQSQDMSSSESGGDNVPYGFQRSPPKDLSYEPGFQPIVLECQGDQLENGFPHVPPQSNSQPHPFVSHDVKEKDWINFLQNIQDSASQDQSSFVRGISAAGFFVPKATQGEGTGASNEVLELWNHHFFHPRRMTVMLAKGPQLDNNDPNDPNDTSDSESSDDEDENLVDLDEKDTGKRANFRDRREQRSARRTYVRSLRREYREKKRVLKKELQESKKEQRRCWGSFSGRGGGPSCHSSEGNSLPSRGSWGRRGRAYGTVRGGLFMGDGPTVEHGVAGSTEPSVRCGPLGRGGFFGGRGQGRGQSRGRGGCGPFGRFGPPPPPSGLQDPFVPPPPPPGRGFGILPLFYDQVPSTSSVDEKVPEGTESKKDQAYHLIVLPLTY